MSCGGRALIVRTRIRNAYLIMGHREDVEPPRMRLLHTEAAAAANTGSSSWCTLYNHTAQWSSTEITCQTFKMCRSIKRTFITREQQLAHNTLYLHTFPSTSSLAVKANVWTNTANNIVLVNTTCASVNITNTHKSSLPKPRKPQENITYFSFFLFFEGS